MDFKRLYASTPVNACAYGVKPFINGHVCENARSCYGSVGIGEHVRMCVGGEVPRHELVSELML